MKYHKGYSAQKDLGKTQGNVKKGLLAGALAFFTGTVGAWFMNKTVLDKSHHDEGRTIHIALTEKRKAEIERSILEKISLASEINQKTLAMDWNRSYDKIAAFQMSFEKVVIKNLADVLEKVIENKMSLPDKVKIKSAVEAVEKDIRKIDQLVWIDQNQRRFAGVERIIERKSVNAALELTRLIKANL